MANFTKGYFLKNKKSIPFPLLFFILPIILSKTMCTALESIKRKPKLTRFVLNMNTNKDLLYAINNRAIMLRRLTFDSIKLMLASKLCNLDITSGLTNPNTKILEKVVTSDNITTMCLQSEKLGKMCADETLYDICALLRIRI